MILPIKLHTREGLMQLWSGVRLFPKQLQMEIKREIDRRNRLRHLGKPFTFILLLCFNILIAQSVVDTTKVYEDGIYALDETEDCSVRAIASAGYSYFKAHEMLKDAGRQDCSPVSLRVMFMSLLPTQRVLLIKETPLTNAKRFIYEIAQSGFTYLVFNRRHVFTIKEGSDGVFKVYGNFNDNLSPIVAYIKLSNGL